MTRKLKPVTKVSHELKQMLNHAIAIEIAANIQYMWQYVQVIGTKGAAVAGKFKATAIAEMKQAEEIAERVWYLNGTPTTQLAPSWNRYETGGLRNAPRKGIAVKKGRAT